MQLLSLSVLVKPSKLCGGGDVGYVDDDDDDERKTKELPQSYQIPYNFGHHLLFERFTPSR